MYTIDISRILDLAVPLSSSTAVCHAHPPITIDRIADGATAGPDNPWTAEQLHLGTHCGTHMDAPRHFFPEGPSLDEYPPERWCGSAAPLDLGPLAPETPITVDRLQKAAASLARPVAAGDILLVRTGWTERRKETDLWQYHSPYVTGEAAEWMVGLKIKGVGIDHYSIGKGVPGFDEAPHGTLLGAGIWIGEDIVMPDALFDGHIWFFAMNPLSVHNASGAPCRPWAAPLATG